MKMDQEAFKKALDDAFRIQVGLGIGYKLSQIADGDLPLEYVETLQQVTDMCHKFSEDLEAFKVKIVNNDREHECALCGLHVKHYAKFAVKTEDGMCEAWEHKTICLSSVEEYEEELQGKGIDYEIIGIV